MAHSIVVPRLGWTMEEGTFVEWLKKDGDSVQAGEMLFILEGEKSSQEIEAVDSGILRIPPDAPQPGQVIPVGALLAYLVAEGEALPWESEAAPVVAVAKAVETPKSQTQESVKPAASEPEKPIISPRARRVARELGVDWTPLNGSGRTGRIRERDVRAVAQTAKVKEPSSPVIPITPVRRVIAERMMAGVHKTAPVTLTTRADATNLVGLRSQFKAVPSGPTAFVPTYMDFLIKLIGQALQQHPKLNASWTDAGILVSEVIHIGIAVDTEAGLLVPVLRDVQSLSLREVAKQSQSLIEQAHARRLTAEQMQGGTFTITNLGMYGIDAFTPILHLPQCAILGVGRIHKEPAVFEDRVVPREILTLSLTFDHRTIDGGPAARFLNMLRQYVEQPAPLLMT